ncbi:MAG: hypothetical protein MUC98_01700, partial [Desulfobacterota bacterium]|nr:hypothetical protein [Thermodesulfobacteriota bacterium]
MNWKEKIRRVCRVFTAALVAVLIASAILFGLVQTNWGIRELARWVSSLDDELDFVPGRVSGVFPFRFEMERLSITDSRGAWLVAGDVRVHWTPLPLIKGQVAFMELVAASVDFDRLPALSGETAEPFPSWILGVRLNRFSVDRLSLGKELLGEQAALKIDGRIPSSSPDRDIEAFFRIERIDTPGSLLQARATVQGETRSLEIEASFNEDRNGLLGKVLGVEGPLSLSLSGRGTPDLWQGKLLAGVLPFGRLSSDLEVKGAETP